MNNAVSLDGAEPQTEILAVVLPDGTPDTPESLTDFVATGTMLLVRHPDGRVALEPASRKAGISREPRRVQATRKRQPIFDPVSREIMGYEMEVSASPALT